MVKRTSIMEVSNSQVISRYLIVWLSLVEDIYNHSRSHTCDMLKSMKQNGDHPSAALHQSSILFFLMFFGAYLRVCVGLPRRRAVPSGGGRR